MRYIAIAIVLAISLVASTAAAHGTGQSLLKYSGDYIASLEYDSQIATIEPQRLSRFSFHVWNKPGTELVDFDEVRVSISKVDSGSTTVFTPLFSGTVYRSEFGVAQLGYRFETGGQYKISLQFGTNGKSLADADFDVAVREIPRDNRTLLISTVASIFLAGIAFLVGRYSRRSTKPMH